MSLQMLKLLSSRRILPTPSSSSSSSRSFFRWTTTGGGARGNNCKRKHLLLFQCRRCCSAVATAAAELMTRDDDHHRRPPPPFERRFISTTRSYRSSSSSFTPARSVVRGERDPFLSGSSLTTAFSSARLVMSSPLRLRRSSLPASLSCCLDPVAATSTASPFSSSSSSAAAAAVYNLKHPKKGTGFDNFIPKDKEDGKDGGGIGDDDENAGVSDKKKNKKSAGFGPFQKSQDTNRGGGSNKNDNNDSNNENNDLNGLVAAAIMLAIVYATVGSNTNRHDDPQHARGGGAGGPGGPLVDREISWQDFLRLLQQQDVLKIVVTEERQMARVYLQPSAKGLAGGSGSGTGGGFSLLPTQQQQQHHRASYEEQRKRLQQSEDNGVIGSSSSSAALFDSTAASDEFFSQEQDQMEGLYHQGGDGAGTGNVVSSAASSIAMTQQQQQQQQPHNPALPMYYRMQIGSIDSFERKLDEAQRAMGRDPAVDIPVQYTADTSLGREFLSAVPGLILAAVLYGMMRAAAGGAGIGGFPGGGGPGSGGASGRGGGMGGIFQIGKSTAKKISKEDVQVTFADVAGCDGAKREIMEFVDFLKDSTRFTRLGAKIPKGALLCGPPGTGKTLLAKAVAGEAGVPFFSISGSDFIEMFVGVGPSRVRDLFAEARQSAPCIVFIDEIDAVGRQRGRGGIGGNDERENTLNQLLVEMDGFEPSTGVVVLAGTNRVDILDQALTRPGRFDRQITVDKPDLKGRKAIFKVHLKGITLEGGSNDPDHVDEVSLDEYASRLAGLTPGFAGADIANICNEAAIVAARRKADAVALPDFEKATDRIIGGLESNKIMSAEERSIVAHHEAGHAVAGWFLEHADPLLKVTIIPRSSGALGFAQYLPKEVFLRTRQQIMDIVCMALAGRAAEEIFFGRVTTGASDDLKRVTDLVYSTVKMYGMNARLGQLAFPPRDPNAIFEDRPYSEQTAKAMDEEARSIVDGAYRRTLDLLQDKKDAVERVAAVLLEKETITHDDIVEIIGPRPFLGDPAYEEFVSQNKKHSKKQKELQEQSDDVESITTAEEEEETEGPLKPGLA